MENNDDVDLKQKGLENFMLLVLGVCDRKISLLHLEKEVFLLWNFDKSIKPYLNFIKHFRGPFSKEIQETILNPFYLEDTWIYFSPSRKDHLSGGYVELSEKGKREYRKLLDKIRKNGEVLHLIAGIKMVRELYDKLSLEELLLLVYDTYPEYIRKSTVYKEIENNKSQIANDLKKKGIVDFERYTSLTGQYDRK